MTLETRIRRSLQDERDSVPPHIDGLAEVVAQGHRRMRWRHSVVTIAGVAALVVAVVAATVVFNNPVAVAASPITGTELPVTHVNPIVLQAHLGPEPEVLPEGTDLTFAPIDEPTQNDLEAISQIIESEQYQSPITVALGSIESAQTHVYVIHDVDPETRSGRSTVLAVGPDFPEFQAESGPTEQGSWGLTSSRELNGDGSIALKVPDFVSYFQVEVNGTVSWQRPADGFIWLPFTAQPGADVLITGHDTTGRVYLRQTLEGDDITDFVTEARATVGLLEARIAEAQERIAAGEGDPDELDALTEAHQEAVTRLQRIEAEMNKP